MADQIRNENVGEVSSPTPEEKVEVSTPAAPEEQAEEAPREETPASQPENNKSAPQRKAPTFAEPKAEKDSPNKAPVFADEQGDSGNAEDKPEKKLPTFKNEGENGGKPARKEPVFKPKERKFPVFANEVKQHQDDDEVDDVDFTSDSITMPFSVPATAAAIGVEASDIAESDGKKKKNRKDKKKNNKAGKEEAVPATVAETEKDHASNMDQIDELSQMGAAGVPFGASYDSATRPYVPTYDKENAIMGAKQELLNFAEPEPMPEYTPFEKNSGASATGGSTKPVSAKKDSWVDPGIEEANALLADDKAERRRRKAANNQPATSSSEPVNAAEAPAADNSGSAPAESGSASAPISAPASVNVKPVDPGIEEAAELLKAAAEEKLRLKALKAAKRDNKNGSEAPAVVVETAEANASGAENAAPTENIAPAVTPAAAEDTAPAEAANVQRSAPLTNAESPKKVMLLLPEDKSGMGVLASDDVEVEAYSVDENQVTPIPMKKIDVPTDTYDKKKSKKDQNAELEALAVVYGAERTRQLVSGNKKDEKNVTHPDAEPYIAPVKATPVKESAPKTVSTAAYDAKKDAKDLKRAQREALAIVYGEEKARAASGSNADGDKSAKDAAVAVVYGDAEPYIAPDKATTVAQPAPKASKEIPTEYYSAAEQKKIDKQEAKAEKKAEKEALLAVAAAEKQKAKEDKALAKEANKPVVAPVVTPVYSDSEPYYAPEKVAPAKAEPKAKKEFSPEAYANKQDKKIDKQEAKAEKKAEKEALLAVAAAEKQKAKEDKALAKEANKPVVAPVVTPVYSDSEPYYAPAKAAPAKAEPKAKKEFSPEAYANKQDKKIDKQEAKAEKKAEKEALLAVAAAEKQKAKEDKALAKEANKPVVAPVVTPVYSDFEPYYAPKKAAPAEQKQNANVSKAAKEIPTEYYSAAEQKKIDKQEAKAEKKAEKEALLAVAAAEKQKAKEDKALAKEANKPVVAPVVTPVYSDSEPYYAPEKVAPAKAEPKAKKEFSPEAYANKQDKKIDKQEAKAEKKAEKEALLAVAAAEKQKAKEDKALAKAEAKAQTKAQTPVSSPVYNDSNYEEGYDPSAFEKAPVAPDNSKAERKAEKNEAKNDSAVAVYEKAKDKKNNRAATAAALVAFYNGNKPVKKTVEKDEPTPVTQTVYPDANYDEGYDPNWAANDKAKLDAEMAANKEARAAQRQDAKASKDAKRDAKNQHKYETHEEKVIREREERDELLLTYKEEIAREKAAKAAAKAAMGKTAPKSEPVEVVYSDYTETFDKNAYDALKKAEADAKAQSIAESKQVKAEKRLAKNATAEEKILADYDNATGRHITNMEKAAEMLAIDKQYTEEEKERAKRARAAEKAIAKGERSLKESNEIVYPDYEEQFDETLYNTELDNAKESAAADELARRNAKADKRNARNNEYENKILSAYDKATGAALAAAEEEAEMLALDKQYTEEEKERAKRARAAEKAIAKGERSLKESNEIVYPDYEEQFDETLYNTELDNAKESAAADELARRNAKADKRNARNNEYENKILAAYDKATGKVVAATEMEAEMLALDKQYTEEEKERAKRARAAEKAIAKGERSLKESNEIVYPDYEEQFDSDLYFSEVETAKEFAAGEELAKREQKLAKHQARVNNRDEKAIAAYDKATGKVIAEKEEKAEMLALDKQYTKEDKEREARARAAEKAVAKAEKTLEPIYESIYPDITETFDEVQYSNILQAEADDAIANDLKKHEAKIEKDIARKNAREDKLISNYDKALGKHINTEAQEKEMVDLARQDEKETKARAKKYKKLLEADMRAAVKADKSGSHGVVYPDPEYLPDEFDDKFLELTAANPGDVIEGKIPRITSVKEIRRAEREDKELALLVNKEKGRLKKIRYDIETLDIADKYVEDGSLEMADARTVMKDAKRSEREDKDRRAVKEYEKNLENEEMIYFSEDYDIRLKTNKKRLKRAKKYGKFMLEYGSTYDPEWDGDFNNYGLPEVHPYTEGVKLSKGRRRTPKKERLSHFDKKKLSELSRSQCKVDNKMIEARVQSEYTALQLEVARVEQEFSGEYRTRKEKHWLRDSRAKLKNLKARITSALKYEKLDNERYYSVVATDFERVDLPAKADREELVAMRDELMRLLDIRDEINTQLLELYTGTENGMRGSTKGRAKATLRARKWAHAKFMRYFRVLNKHRVTRNEKMRIFDKMDEVVDLKGQLARANYILRKERPVGKVKREYLKERKIAKRDIRILKKSIERSTVRALIKARKREKQERAMVLAYSIFALIALFVVAMVFMGPTIIQATKLLVPENFHKYLDIILKYWPL